MRRQRANALRRQDEAPSAVLFEMRGRALNTASEAATAVHAAPSYPFPSFCSMVGLL